MKTKHLKEITFDEFVIKEKLGIPENELIKSVWYNQEDKELTIKVEVE